MGFIAKLFGRNGAEHDVDQPTELIRHEDELGTGARWFEIGSVRARKGWEPQVVRATGPRYVQSYEGVERVPAGEHDSGQIEELPDGSVSIPVLEERLVVTRQTVVRERVILHRRHDSREVTIRALLRRERVDVDADPGVTVYDERTEGERHRN